MARDFSKYAGKRSDAERREEIGFYITSFEKEHGVSLTKTSGHRGPEHKHRSHNHELYGAHDIAVNTLDSKMQKKFMVGAAARGFRVVDEIDAKGSKGKRNVVHLDLATQEEIGPVRWSFSKNKEVPVDKAGTIRKESDGFRTQDYGKIEPIRRETTVAQGVEAGEGIDDPLSERPVDASTFVEVESRPDIEQQREEYVTNTDTPIPEAVEEPVIDNSFDSMMSNLASKPVERSPVIDVEETPVAPSEELIAPSEEPIETPYIPEEQQQIPIDHTGAASNEVEVIQDQDEQIDDMREEQLMDAQHAGGRRPSGISLATDSQEEAEQTESEQPYEWSSGSDFGGSMNNVTGLYEELTSTDTTGLDKDLTNKIIDRSMIGLIAQNAQLAFMTNDKVDNNYDPQSEPEVFEELTKDLDNDQLEKLLTTYGNNRHDFILGATSMNDSNNRRNEMNDYSSQHPVLSGVTTVGVILGEAATFSFAASAVTEAATAAIQLKYATDLSRAARLGLFAAGEVIEQGVEELVWSSFEKDYEFDPKLFGLSVLAGAGIRNVLHNSTIDKTLREILDNQGGFIQLTGDKSKDVVDALKVRVNTEQGIALIDRLQSKKLSETKRLVKLYSDDISTFKTDLKQARIGFKAAKKGTPEYKVLKALKQKLTRQLKAAEKKLPNELEMLKNGTHPKLTAAINPEMTLKKVAKGLELPKEVINSPQALRKFFNIDSPDVASDFVIDGEKSYANIMNIQMKEMANNVRLNANETMKYMSKQIGDNFLGNKLYDYASTDGPISRYLFNKGNLTSSENPTVSTFYNWLAPDGMGRTGSSKIRAVESQQKYDDIFSGFMLTDFHAHGDELYGVLKGIDNKLVNKISSTFNVDDYENTVTDMFRQRLLLGKEKFKDLVDNPKVSDIADNFADSFNKNNKKIIDRAKEVGVKGIEFDHTDDWFHRSWDYTKARAVDKVALEDSVFTGMKKYMDDVKIKYDVDDLKIQAKKFAFGIRNADITTVEGAQKGYIEYLTKLANKGDGDVTVITNEVVRLTSNKLKSELGDLANRTKIDVNVPIAGSDMMLSDILEDNFINTQKRYNSRMAARVAAAEHGVKDINTLDDWVKDAVEEEVKRQAKKGVSNPRLGAKHVKEAMEMDLKSFKNGNISGLGDIQDDNVHELLRFVKKYNYAALMQYTGISSIAELGGTVAEAGVGTTLDQLKRTMIPYYKKLFTNSPKTFTDTLYDDMSAFTGIGLEDYAFSSKGTSAGERVFKGSSNRVMNKLEKGVDSISRLTQGTFGHIEVVGRRATNNSLGISWANHFTGKGNGGLLSSFLGPKKLSNRVLENSGLASFNDKGELIFSDMYKKIGKEITDKAEFNESGRLVSLNMEKWDTNTAHQFGDVIKAQTNHIFVNPDSTTMANWQASGVGQILNQFRTFTVNSATKVAAYSVANAHQGLKRGDVAESKKLANKIFWGGTLGVMSVMLRDGIKNAGNENKGATDIFDEGAFKAAMIGLSRSSIVGQMPTLVDTVSGTFGGDPFFEKSSNIGRSRDFFNLSTSPTGQAINKTLKSGSDILKGDVGKGVEGLFKSSPIYRQIGVQQMFNLTQEE